MIQMNNKYYSVEYNKDGTFKGYKEMTQDQVDQQHARMRQGTQENYWSNDHS